MVKVRVMVMLMAITELYWSVKIESPSSTKEAQKNVTEI